MLPMMVKFNSTSASPPSQHFETWRWDYGDGATYTLNWADRTPEAVNPRHLYTTYRDHFDVCLKVTTICGKSNEFCDQVQVHCKKPRAGFTVDKTDGVAPMWVHMTDTSQHTPESVTTWVYKKGGTTFSSERSPAFYFTGPGDYTITQTVKKTCNPDSDSYSRDIHIREPIRTYTVMNLSFPTTTPTIAVVGMYLNLSNTTPAATTTTLTTTTHTAAAAATPTRAAAAATTTAGAVATPALTTTLYGAPPASGTGTLSVITAPPGAEVYVDDVLRGASPVTVPGLSAGSHTLRLVRDGYQAMIVPVDIPGGKTTDYSTSLIPASGGMGVLPLIGGAVVILALAAGGAYLYMKQKKAP
jgi:PKD repeat protein